MRKRLRCECDKDLNGLLLTEVIYIAMKLKTIHSVDTVYDLMYS